MNDLRCEQVRERLPELATGRLDGPEARRLERHLDVCASCAEERSVLTLLARGRPSVPAGLPDRIKAGLEDAAHETVPSPRGSRRGRAPAFPWWGLAAAAVTAVALGVGIQVRSPALPDAGDEGASFAMEVEEEDLWLSGDGEIAGAPTLDDLTDEALLRFLEELETGGVA